MGNVDGQELAVRFIGQQMLHSIGRPPITKGAEKTIDKQVNMLYSMLVSVTADTQTREHRHCGKTCGIVAGRIRKGGYYEYSVQHIW